MAPLLNLSPLLFLFALQNAVLSLIRITLDFANAIVRTLANSSLPLLMFSEQVVFVLGLRHDSPAPDGVILDHQLRRVRLVLHVVAFRETEQLLF
jgi:hypothetical protein